MFGCVCVCGCGCLCVCVGLCVCVCGSALKAGCKRTLMYHSRGRVIKYRLDGLISQRERTKGLLGFYASLSLGSTLLTSTILYRLKGGGGVNPFYDTLIMNNRSN